MSKRNSNPALDSFLREERLKTQSAESSKRLLEDLWVIDFELGDADPAATALIDGLVSWVERGNFDVLELRRALPRGARLPE